MLLAPEVQLTQEEKLVVIGHQLYFAHSLANDAKSQVIKDARNIRECLADEQFDRIQELKERIERLSVLVKELE